MKKIELSKSVTVRKELVGVDVFLDWNKKGRDPDALGKILKEVNTETVALKMITNRGVRVYPGGFPGTFCTDHWRCRFVGTNESNPVTHAQILELLTRINDAGLDNIKTENLYTFDGERGYSLGQGE